MSPQCFYHGLWDSIMSTKNYKTDKSEPLESKVGFELNGIPNERDSVDHSRQVCEWDGCVCFRRLSLMLMLIPGRFILNNR